jgi:hypothetical protein
MRSGKGIGVLMKSMLICGCDKRKTWKSIRKQMYQRKELAT